MHLVKVHDKDLDKVFKIPLFDENQMAEEKYKVYIAIENSINLMIKNKWDKVPCFVLLENELEEEYIFSMDIESCEENILSCFDYYEENEEYEKCADLKKLSNKLSKYLKSN